MLFHSSGQGDKERSSDDLAWSCKDIPKFPHMRDLGGRGRNDKDKEKKCLFFKLM
jgi:hypothetical protein